MTLDPAVRPAGEAPGIAFTDRRRPEDATRVRLSEWEGPLGLLLALVEARRFDVMTVPLGALAEAYLDALAGLEDDRLGNLSAFVAVASQLILIKSRELLPRPPAPAIPMDDEPDAEAALRARLIAYRAFRDAADRLAGPAAAGRQAVRREPSIAGAAARAGAVEPLPPCLDPALLVGALDRLAAVAPAVAPPPEAIPRTITMEERAALIRAALAEAGSVVLQDLLVGVRERVVIAVTFLAMLELVKRREITIEQDAPWGPIIVRSASRAVAPVRARGGDHPDEEDA
ncbi:MAG TPA: ScpA family protein [Candidatus Nanopelagicales bacterium]|nr:ScpA family protein [Candidatus Nanopelagicales bacterium]